MNLGRKIREEVARRARFRCEYCRIHDLDAGFPHQADHVVSVKHGGQSGLDNLAYACAICNRRKGSDIASIDPITGELVGLFNPRQQRWSDHFRLDAEWIIPVTRIGEATARLLGLNLTERLAERRLLQSLGRYPSG